METYNKLRVIGKGSYGEVWLVRHKRDKKQYVLKKMDLHNASKRERTAAEQEAKLLSKLRHPNIVGYKDSFETSEGLLYIAMGYCEGGDLYTRLKEQKGSNLEERQIVEWFVQIAMALQYMHERNILHRDLKTQNIFLTKSKIIKVGDLGIARVLDNSTDMATTLIGTPYYMSPELFSNKPYNHKSDVWALGCCVYEMTTLKHAFNAKDMNSLVYKILRGRMPAMPKQYSPELVTLIKAMLHQEPDKRPSVNRILRDPYIKRNIAIFLEGTKKRRTVSRPSSSSSTTSSRPNSGERSRPSSVSSEIPDVPDRAREVRPLPKARPSPSPVDEHLEPLNVPKGLDPIIEISDQSEDLSGSGGSRQAHRRRPPTPKSRSETPSYSEDPRHLHPGNVPPSYSNHANVQHRRRRLPQDPPQVVVSVQDDYNAHVLSHAKPVLKPRPLPQRPGSSGGERNGNCKSERVTAKPVKSKSPSRHSEQRESGYASSSASSSVSSNYESGANHADRLHPGQAKERRNRPSVSEPVETPRAVETPRQFNTSARQRRREKKESETPRPTVSKSVDIDQRRRKSDSDVSRRSVDNHQPTRDQRNHVHHPLRKQPSVGKGSSSSSSSTESEDEKSPSPEKDKKRKDKEMNAFIHQLDSTLQMNHEDANSDDDSSEPRSKVEPQVKQLKPLPEARQVEASEFEEPAREQPRIIETIKGKTLSATGRLMDRIAILRKDCIKGLGFQKLSKAYDILDNIDEDEIEPQLVELLGKKDYELYAGKIWQLKFCEESAFGLN